MDLNTVDELAPGHQRTSCSDADLNGNQYFNEFGYPRCIRCAMLYRVRKGEWPHNAKPKIEILRLLKKEKE